MAEAGELEEIKASINASKNFLLSGGAGSGKTYTLIETLKFVYTKNPASKVICITYTNMAMAEIKQRAPFDTLLVSTIHDFMWSFISQYQQDIKKALIMLLEDGKIQYAGAESLDLSNFADKKIEYREWRDVEQGIVSHDDILPIAQKMFQETKLLARILLDTYDYIFIDEYQDTADEVLDILLNQIKQPDRKCVVGLFGDKMQAIYKDNADTAEGVIRESGLQEIKKQDNRRNPKRVIDFINCLRLDVGDRLTQSPAADSNAPNFQKQGSAKFIYSTNENYSISRLKELQYCRGWDFDNPRENKVLYLVKKLIAGEAGFPTLMDIYANDKIIQYKNLIRKEIKEQLILIEEDKTFGEVIDICKKKPSKGKMDEFIKEHPDLFEMAKQVPYTTFRNIYLSPDQLIGSKKKYQEQDSDTGKKRDYLINYLLDIQECIQLYRDGEYNSFIDKTDYEISSVESKIHLSETIKALTSMTDKSIGEIVDFAHEKDIRKKTSQIQEFINTNSYTFNRVKEVKYSELVSLFNYIEDYTPYSTQHNIKGAEYDRVLVVLDNGGWFKYNFQNLFDDTLRGRVEIKNRTARLFYVCCSRAKKELVVYFHKPSLSAIAKAKQWFGDASVICIDN